MKILSWINTVILRKKEMKDRGEEISSPKENTMAALCEVEEVKAQDELTKEVEEVKAQEEILLELKEWKLRESNLPVSEENKSLEDVIDGKGVIQQSTLSKKEKEIGEILDEWKNAVEKEEDEKESKEMENEEEGEVNFNFLCEENVMPEESSELEVVTIECYNRI